MWHQSISSTSITYSASNKSQEIALKPNFRGVSSRRVAFLTILLTPLSHIAPDTSDAECRRESFLPFKSDSFVGLRGELNPLRIRLLFFREIDEIRRGDAGARRYDGKADGGTKGEE